MARVEAKVKIDYKDYRDFYLYSLMTNKSIKSFLIVFCLALLVSLGLTIFTVINKMGNLVFGDFILPIVFTGLILCYGVIFFSSTFLTYRKGRETFALTTYYFFEEDKIVYSLDENKNITRQVRYKDLSEVVETKKAFYIYVDRSKSFLVIKSKITKGQPNDLANMLLKKTKCPYKINNKNKKR